ncbi:MAG: dienelactone hydrolase family protein [Candidatus Korobacteraceae bacterium]
MPAIQSNYVELAVADGSTMRAWYTRPVKQAGHAGLMLFQEAFGVNAHIRSVADRFAEVGYVVIAPELYHRSAPEFEGKYEDTAAGIALARQLKPEELEQDVRATYDFLRQTAEDQIACVGYCMGGRVSFVANVTVPVKAAVSYYGGGLADMIGRASDCTGPMLFFWGEQDQHIPAEQRQKVVEGMRESKHQSVQVTFSDAGHAFFNDQRPSYNPAAAKLAWDMTLSFFEQNLKEVGFRAD